MLIIQYKIITAQIKSHQWKKPVNGDLKFFFFRQNSGVYDSLKFFSRVVLTPKMWPINVIMMSYLQKLRHIFSSSRFYFIAYRFRCDYSRGLKLNSINK